MEHRWGARQATDVRVEFVAVPGGTGAGRLLDVSMTGAYMSTQVPLRLLSLVHLTPAARPGADAMTAYVVRCDATGVGLEWCKSAAGAPASHRQPARTDFRCESG